MAAKKTTKMPKKLTDEKRRKRNLGNCIRNAAKWNGLASFALAKALEDATDPEVRMEILNAHGAARVLATTLGNLSVDCPF